MNRLLSAPGLDAAPRTLGMPDPALDGAALAAVERAAADAYEQGRRDGAAQAEAAAQHAAAGVLAALQRADADMRDVAARADTGLALDIARAVIGREPCDDAATLLERVCGALRELDDDRIAVHLSAADSAELGDALRRAAAEIGTAIDVVEDAVLPAGEAVLAGRWARADLTRARAWTAVSQLLEGDAGA